MKALNRHFLQAIIISIVASILFSCGSNKELEQLAASFENPPSSAHPGAFWCWLNGSMTKERITYDLEAMKSKDITRAEIWDVAAINNSEMVPGGSAFMSDESVDLIKHAISEARRLGMRIGMIASSGWNAGGSWVTPDWASKALYYSETNVNGPGKVSLALPFPRIPNHCPKNDDGTPVFYKEIAVVAVPFSDDKTIDPSQIVNLTGSFSAGKLDWDAPEGKWTIIRFICSNTGQRLIVPSPNSNGLFIDFLDPNATKRHLKYFMDRLGVTPANAAESGLDYYEFDSMELEGGTPWTDSMSDVFKELRGYPVDGYFPVFAGWKYKNREDLQFMYDFHKTVSDRLIFSHYTTAVDFLKEYHADLVAESGGPGPPVWNTCPVDALKALGNVSIPRGEFWIQHRNMFLVKEIASAAHIYGKKEVDAESFTTWRRWLDSPFEMKKYVDRAYSEGLNCVTFHTYASTNPADGYPGRTYHAGIDMNTGTTWWEKSKPFMDYLSRCNQMLRQGLFVADVCYYYGDQAPNFFPLYHDVPEKPRLNGLGKGYDYDVVNTDVILNRMTVKDGKIVLPDGMSYALMMLPDQNRMTLQVLKKLETLVEAGAVVLGSKPDSIPGICSAEDFEQFREISGKLWGNIGSGITEHPYGKGKIICSITAGEVLKKAGIGADFRYDGIPAVDYIHRSSGAGEIYFLSNESEEWTKGVACFRVNGKIPEIWDPSTGVQYSAGEFTKDNGGTSVSLELPPHGSLFVVFADQKRKLPKLDGKANDDEQVLSPPWTVNFTKGWGAPEEVVFDKLHSWTDFDDPGIKYFSGTAAYHKTFTVPNERVGKKCIIDLGEVKDIAEIYVNGKSAGILWKPPFKADITALLRSGENELKIEIVNMWANRLTGDNLLKPEERYCRTNQPWSENIILPSGLFGPVKLQYGK